MGIKDAGRATKLPKEGWRNQGGKRWVWGLTLHSPIPSPR